MFEKLLLTYKRASKDTRANACLEKLRVIAEKRMKLKAQAMAVQKKYESILEEP